MTARAERLSPSLTQNGLAFGISPVRETQPPMRGPNTPISGLLWNIELPSLQL